MFEYKAKVLRVVDGDTVDLEVDLGFRTLMRDRFRLSGIDTPETYGVKKGSEEYKAGMKAKEWLEEKIGGEIILIKTHKDKRGKYGRWLCEIFIPIVDDQLPAGGQSDILHDLNKEMVKLGLAKEYGK